MSIVAFLAQTLRIAIPYLLAAAGGVLSERACLIGLTLEGYMLGGAFCAAVGSYAAGAPWVGVLAAVVGGGALALLYAMSAIRFKADQVVIGIAINLLAIGLTRFSFASSLTVRPTRRACQALTSAAAARDSARLHRIRWCGWACSSSRSWAGCCIARHLAFECEPLANTRRRRRRLEYP